MRRRRTSKTGYVLVAVVILVAAVVLLGRTQFLRDIRDNGGATLVPLPDIVKPEAAKAVTPTPTIPDATGTARQFFQLWQDGKFDDMYNLLSEAARGQIARDAFVKRYRNITEGVGIVSVNVDFKSSLTESVNAVTAPSSRKMPYSIALQTGRFGQIKEDNELQMVLEDGQWRMDWSPSLIFKGLTADSAVRISPDDPERGAILDRKGRPLAQQGKILSIGVVPGKIQDEAKVLNALSLYLGMKPEVIKARYANAQPDWWVPLKDFPVSQRDDARGKLGGIPGVDLRDKEARVYPNGTIGANVAGYISAVNADDLKKLAAKGYEESDLVGRTGVEASEEETLAGKKGGKLLLVGSDSATIRTIAEQPAVPGSNVQLTIDIDVQRVAEQTLGDKVGSIVVMDPRDNSILALASHPTFDPNAFVFGISDADWQKLANDKNMPFQNRPVSSAYPTGSIFKVITMAAGLEKGGFTPDSMFDDPGTWTLPGTNQVFHDWVPNGHGRLSLVEGLAESCDIVFYTLGYELYKRDPNILPSFSRSFGLGQTTGVVGLTDVAGTLPDPDWKQRTVGQAWFPGDSVNLAIGQGYLEATPLQMANVYSTLANGGTLRTPLLVKRIGDGATAKEFASESKGQVPVSPASLAAIHEGMIRVASSPKGTAYYAFQGYKVPVAAKTGSAENQNPEAHAWFAGYAPANKPEIVVIAMVEGGRAGGEVAAPLGRKVFEGYFSLPQ